MRYDGRMKQVTISRKRWCRGGKTDASLKTPSGQSCCLGFVARAYGLKTPEGSGQFSDLADDQSVTCLPKSLRPTRLGSLYPYSDTPLHDKLVNTNDDSVIKPAEREATIKTLLAQAGIKVIFKD
jgi:hypothetical protein